MAAIAAANTVLDGGPMLSTLVFFTPPCLSALPQTESLDGIINQLTINQLETNPVRGARFAAQPTIAN
jgi:hypothetical protein